MDTKENAVNVGTGAEPTEELRQQPGKVADGKPVVPGSEEPLKSERVEEALRAMPDWELALEGQAITREKQLPTTEVAMLYAAYVNSFAGALGLPVAVGVAAGLVLVTLYAPGGECTGGLTESVLDFARQIG